MLPRLKPHYGHAARSPARRRGRGGPGSRCSSAASPTRCSPRRTRRRPACCRRTAARSWIPRGQVCCGAMHYHAAPRSRRAGVRREQPGERSCRASAEVDADHRQRRRLRRDAQGLRPPVARHPARRGRGAIRRQGPRHQRVPGRARPDEADASAEDEGDLSRRLPSLPRPADPQASRGSCWR